MYHAVSSVLPKRLSLGETGDFPNVLTLPNFGSPINYLSSPQFGQSTQMLANYWDTAVRVAD